MWVRIDSGRVAEITNIDPDGRYHPSIQWELADESVDIGDYFDGRSYSKPIKDLEDIAREKRICLEKSRKSDEAVGVTVNGIRYAGDPGNRQSIMEALDLADTNGQVTLASWKDSDHQFHLNHPVDDIRQAMLEISTRRGQLISREGELNAEIDAAVAAEDREALEAIEWVIG